MAPEAQAPRRGGRLGRPRIGAFNEGCEVRERLLDAATELAVEKGFDGSGIREIAARARVSSGMISYYFRDRQGLYEAMFQRAFDRVGEQVRARMEDPERLSNDPLDELVRIQVESIAADPWLPQLIVREVLARADSRTRLAESVGQGPLQLMIRWLEEEQARGVLLSDFDPRMMAISIVSLSVFPFLMLPVVAEELGLGFDEAFPKRLIEHNQRMLAFGLRARTE